MSKIWEAVKALGALDPRKLVRFTDANLDLVAGAACRSCGEVDKLEDTIDWLKELRSEALLKPKAEDHKLIEEWRQRCYLYSARMQETLQREVVAETQAAHCARKTQASYPASSAVTSLVGGRCAASKRKARDEAQRESWALRALAVLATSGLIPKSQGIDAKEKERLLVRLKRGLRFRTIKARALSAERIHRWCKLELGQDWIRRASELEDMMKDLASGGKAGSSTFDRLRYAVVYLEAAAGTDAENQLGNDSCLKGTIKELAYKESCAIEEEKKQAPQHLIRILARWEEAVCDGSTPAYLQGYLWLKLVTFWGVIRGEDSTYLDPASMKLIERGLCGKLTQTKTTGPGKKVRIRHFEVCKEAYFVDADWIRTGFEFWKGQDQSRENFILLPGPGYEGCRELGAEIQDRMALTRKCLKDFGIPPPPYGTWSEKLIAPVIRFWTEHSSRSSLVSMARALGVPKEVTDRLGWWAVGTQASEEYIRTYSLLAAKAQKLVACTSRKALEKCEEEDAGDPDYYGEERVLEKLVENLEKKGFKANDREVINLVESLRIFRTTTVTEPEAKPKWEANEGLMEVEQAGVPATKELFRVEEDDEEEEESLPEIGTWIISDAAFRGTKCLHIVGSCYRQPKIHYKMWTTVADPVCPTSFKKACKTCFPEGYPWEDLSMEEVVEPEVEVGMLGAQEGEEDSASEA